MDQIIYATMGGAFIGLSAAGMMLSNGRVMGISGIVGGLFQSRSWNFYWRLAFVLGMVIGAVLIKPLGFSVMSVQVDRSIYLIIVGGFFVGLGTTIGNGCTSGHGICGISRFSIRSVVATCTFMISGIVTVYILKFFGVGS